MNNLKLNFSSNDRQLANNIKIISDDSIRIIESVGLFGNTEITVAIIAATPVILTQVASVIKTYIEKNMQKSFSFKINDNEVSLTGYSLDEINEILNNYANKINNV